MPSSFNGKPLANSRIVFDNRRMSFEALRTFFEEHTVWISGAAGLSLFLLVGSVLLAPRLLCQLPADYFHNPHHRPLETLSDRPALRWPLLLAKNMLGILLFLVGLSMLVLPGQGILTLIMAVVLTDFPGKFACKRSFIEVPRVADWINRLRSRYGKPPFQSS